MKPTQNEVPCRENPSFKQAICGEGVLSLSLEGRSQQNHNYGAKFGYHKVLNTHALRHLGSIRHPSVAETASILRQPNAQNVVRESRSRIATINFFEAHRTAGQQATHLGRNAMRRECVRARLCERDEATNGKWIADFVTAY